MEKRTLLIADDEAKIRNGILTYLRVHADFLTEIYEAENGSQALDIIYKKHPDAMLLDVQMPEKDGFQVMKEAIRGDVCPKTIILSGYDEFKYAQSALRLGALDYILKPCRPTEIVEKLKTLFELSEEEEKNTSGAGNEVERNSVIEAAKEYIHDHYETDMTLVSIAEQVRVSPTYLSSLFSKYEQCGFVDYLSKYRIEQSKMYLHDTSLKTYEVAYKVGFRDEKYYSKVFKKLTGMSPSEYRKSFMK